MPIVSQVRIQKFSEDLWTPRANLTIELLIGAQLLFLNSFSEMICKKAKSMLKTVFELFRIEHGSLVVGEYV